MTRTTSIHFIIALCTTCLTINTHAAANANTNLFKYPSIIKKQISLNRALQTDEATVNVNLSTGKQTLPGGEKLKFAVK